MNHDHPLGDPQELAALYSAGSMPLDQAATFEAHLVAGCGACRSAVHELEGVVANLLEEISPVRPDARVRDAIMARISTAPAAAKPCPSTKAARECAHEPPQPWRDWSSDAFANDIIIRRAAESGWEETGVAGVRVRRLRVDRDKNQMTALIRMAPGTSWPSHEHDGAEECLVLEGDLRAGDHVFRAGDYQCMSRGSQHGVQSTEGGCLLLIVSSLTDKHN